VKKIAADAEARGIKLGVENRQALEELPIESDYQFLFREVASPSLVYWHDTGHAQIKENLDLSIMPCIWNPRLSGFTAFIFMMCNFRAGTTALPVRQR